MCRCPIIPRFVLCRLQLPVCHTDYHHLSFLPVGHKSVGAGDVCSPGHATAGRNQSNSGCVLYHELLLCRLNVYIFITGREWGKFCSERAKSDRWVRGHRLTSARTCSTVPGPRNICPCTQKAVLGASADRAVPGDAPRSAEWCHNKDRHLQLSETDSTRLTCN